MHFADSAAAKHLTKSILTPASPNMNDFFDLAAEKVIEEAKARNSTADKKHTARSNTGFASRRQKEELFPGAEDVQDREEEGDNRENIEAV